MTCLLADTIATDELLAVNADERRIKLLTEKQELQNDALSTKFGVLRDSSNFRVSIVWATCGLYKCK